MNSQKLQGLVAATYTPFDGQGGLRLDVVPDLVECLISQRASGLYVCGSTGEGMSLSTGERRSTTEAYVQAVAGRVPVVVQVGHNCLAEACGLAMHAQEIGADAISATCPSYFKVANTKILIECMAELAAAASSLPFYYYHIPALTGSTLDMVEFLRGAPHRIPSLAGLKYTDTKLYEFQECLELDDGRFDVVWGCDEMLLGALATGATSAIGSTYNIAAPLYYRMIKAFESNDLREARRLQTHSIAMIRTLNHYPFHSAMKAVLAMQGFEVGACRMPQGKLSESEVVELRGRLESIGFFDWSVDQA